MNTSLETLLAIPGVIGLVFHRGQEIVEEHLPATWGAASVRMLCRAVIQGFSGYAAAGRQATQCWFEFPEGCVLSLTPPLQENQITRSMARGTDQPQQLAAPSLTFILADPSALDNILVPANSFLARQAAVQMDLWLACREELLRILSKVTDLPAAKRLLANTMADQRLSLQASVAPADFRLLGETLIRQIPDATVQPSLLEAWDTALQKLLNSKPRTQTRAI